MNTNHSIHSFFEEYAQANPAHKAIESANCSLSFGELNERANQLAHYLQRQGISHDVPVAVCMERSVEFMIIILAVLKAGGAYLPIDLNHPDDRLLFILHDSSTPVLITKGCLKHKFSTYSGRTVLLDDEAESIARESNKNPKNHSIAENLAYIIYTSGSTGMPKGVQIEHRNAINYCLWFADYSQLKAQQRLDFSSNPNFDMAITLTLAPLMLGLTIVICDEAVKKDLRLYLDYLQQHKINCIKATPSYFKVLVQEVKNSFITLPELKHIILGGEQLTKAECSAWLELYPHHKLINEYGPTETTVGISIQIVDKDNINEQDINIPIGIPGTNMHCYILDSNNQQVKPGDSGELYIGGRCVARGYLNRAELNEKHFIHDPFHADTNSRLYKTGDLCRLLANGVIEYLGRIDQQIKIRGFRIEPGEIEKQLAAHQQIEAVVVLAQEDINKEKRLVAYFIAQDGTQVPTALELRDFLGTSLPDYMIPAAFVEVHFFPLTANGKLDKNELPNPEYTASQNFVAPSCELEQTVAAIWAKELGLSTVGIDDDFFELGGHSLSAARIVSALNAALDKQIGIHNFYQATSIRKLITHMQLHELSNDHDISQHDISPIDTTPPAYDKEQIPLGEFQLMLWMANTFEPKAKKLNITARKRFQGSINKEALAFACQALIKKQEALIYQILTFSPAQRLKKHTLFQLNENSLTHLSRLHSEQELERSITELGNFYPWPKEAPLFFVRLFQLKNNCSEIQICMSHMIADDASPDILFADLSKYYLQYSQSVTLDGLQTDTLYKEYIQEEQHYHNTHLERDSNFWQDYLQDANLFSFPKDYVVDDMSKAESAYSTYTEISEQELTNLKQFCASHHVTVNDGLCAATAYVLNKYRATGDESVSLFMNRIKSTREKKDYDGTIGCFLRLEPIKVIMNNEATFSSLSEQIHQASIDTSQYQRCPGLVKLTSIKTMREKNNRLKSFLAQWGSACYSSIFGLSNSHRRILKQCLGPLMSFKRNNNYMISINIHSNFIATERKDTHLFGLETLAIEQPQQDLLNIDNYFDVCFLRNNARNAPYMVISANLQPEFREQVAREVIELLGSAA